MKKQQINPDKFQEAVERYRVRHKEINKEELEYQGNQLPTYSLT